MANTQMFPETVEEYMEEYKLVDEEHTYSNGGEFVPIFRMRQWFEHEKAKRDSIDDLYFLLDENSDILDAMYLTKDQVAVIKYVLDIVEHCGNEFTLVSAIEDVDIQDFRPKKGEQ